MVLQVLLLWRYRCLYGETDEDRGHAKQVEKVMVMVLQRRC